MVKRVFKTIIDILLSPFTKHFHFFIVFFLLATSCHVRGVFSMDNLHPAIATTMHGLNLSYIATLLVSLIRPRIAQQIVQTILIVFAATDFALNYYCVSQFNYLFDVDLAHLILDTDPGEATEFLTTMVPMRVVLAIVGAFLILTLFWWYSKRRDWNLNLGRKMAILAFVVTCFCVAGNLFLWNVWKWGPLAPIYQLPSYDMPSDLKSYYSHPQFTYEEEYKRPVNVVLIIGESITRSHSSLYGYEKETNPELTKLKNTSMLFAFDSINSPAISTAKSMKDMLSLFNNSDTILEKKWYEYPTLIEIMKVCGYQCYWFGNQSCASTHNAITRLYAQDCDRRWLLQQEGLEDIGERRQDIILVDSSYQYVKKFKQLNHNFVIYHMLGSHFDYSKRYPKAFAKFSPDDYLNEPESHRGILSSYDNSILYNDYVVKRIIDLFKDSESVIIYLPDHGQVMYRNKIHPDHYAHGVPIDPYNHYYGIDIPFFVYTSPLFQQHYPETIERIKNRQDNPKSWNSEDLPFLIMDLIGVKQINGENVRPRSII